MVSKRRLTAWLFEGHKSKPDVHKEPWWRVMCLVGVDYFSSMGFQPGLSFLAAGLLSPLATLNLVILTLLGALPAYWIVSQESPHGQGSVAIYERLFKGWTGKTIVLVILAFAATDFIFTITMCAADATAHIVENPLWPEALRNRVLITLVLIGSLGAFFLKGFKEAIALSVALVGSYLVVNFFVIGFCLTKIFAEPAVLTAWLTAVNSKYPSASYMLAVAALAFPQLALGLSGFETGVAVMPLIKTKATTEEEEEELKQRIAKTRVLLITVALIMGVFLLCGSLVTTVLIEPRLFELGQEANGRALAYLTHLYLGEGFGTVYDIITVAILWFAGASGMAALLSLVPQYLPRYGMAPSWAGARRPLVIVFMLLSFAITIAFKADVDSQAGAFATGLLVLITSGIIAVTLLVWKKNVWLRIAFSLISCIFIYSSLNIMVTRPDGLAIAMMFIVLVFFTSLLSRSLRATELRIGKVQFDEKAQYFIKQACHRRWGLVRLLAHKPEGDEEYEEKQKEARFAHSVQTREGNFIFLEVTPTDVSEFMDDTLEVNGVEKDGFQILRCQSPGVPNAIAAILLHIREITHQVPHVYFGWTEGHPIGYVIKFILFGEGETAPLTREILRSNEPDPEKRPRVHVG